MRPQPHDSIMHLEILGRAICEANGCEITVNPFELKQDPRNIFLKTATGQSIFCLINATGEDVFPGILPKVELDFVKKYPLLRTQGTQINISAPAELITKFAKISNRCFVVFGKLPKDNVGKIQITLLLTPHEQNFLDEIIRCRYPFLDNISNLVHQNNVRRTFKVFLVAEFLGYEKGIDIKLERDICHIKLRDQIKLGKKLSGDFTIPQPAMAPLQAVQLQKTSTLYLKVGRAFGLFALTGRYTQQMILLTQLIVDYLIQNGFKPGWIQNEGSEGHAVHKQLNEIIEGTERHVLRQHKKAPDQSQKMATYVKFNMFKENEDMQLSRNQQIKYDNLSESQQYARSLTFSFRPKVANV